MPTDTSLEYVHYFFTKDLASALRERDISFEYDGVGDLGFQPP